MENLETFVRLSEQYGKETEVFIEMEDGRILEVFGIRPSDKGNGLILRLSPRPYDYRNELMED